MTFLDQVPNASAPHLLGAAMSYYKERRWEVERDYADGRKKIVKQVRHDFRITLPDGRRVTRSFKSKEAGQRWVSEQERLAELGADFAGVERARRPPWAKMVMPPSSETTASRSCWLTAT